MAIWTKNAANQPVQQAQGQQNMGGALGGSSLTGLGSGYLGTNGGSSPMTTREVQLQEENNRLKWELASQESLRKQDAFLIRRNYRMWAWLKDTHPEVVEEFEAVEDLLKASGERF
ncbi:hypothetical protein D3C87_905840 [compost metagenome]